MPDVSGQISTHNADENAHFDIRSALNDLAKINLHWWRRRTEESGYTFHYDAAITLQWGNAYAGTTYTLYYSNGINIDQTNGTLTLTDPSSKSVKSYESYTISGKYFSLSNDGNGDVYYCESGKLSLTTKSNYNTNYFWHETVPALQKVSATLVIDVGEYEYVSSPNRNEYPDSGMEGIFSYTYLGIPFENAREGAKVVTGSYVGTGTYGSEATANSLTFDGKPRFLAISAEKGDGTGIIVEPTKAESSAAYYSRMIYMHNSISAIPCKFDETTNTFYWYSSGAPAQLNQSGYTYNYIAIV